MSNSASLSLGRDAVLANAPPSGGGLAGTLGTDGLFALCILLAVVALVAVLSTIRDRRSMREAARRARQQGEAMRELLRSVRMAESIAGVGVWQYDHLARVQQWSDGLKRLFGVDPAAELVEGDAETLLYANNIDLVGMVCQHFHKIEPFTFEFEIFGFDGIRRTIAVQACNLRNTEGEVQRVVAVVRDVTSNIEARIEAAREWDEIEGPAQHPLLQRAGKCDELDAMTGLANRRRLMHELDRLVIDARTSHRPMVLVIFDVDRLSKVNSEHGRETGDRVLQQVARLAQEQAREHDVLGRISGKQFAWIIPRSSEGTARVMTERLRQTIARGSGVDAARPVTISLGFAGIQAGDTALALFARANDALSEAKHSGRNRVRVAA